MERLSEQLHKDNAFDAKLHGFKMNAPIKIQKWSSEDDNRMKDLALKRFEQMNAEADLKSQAAK